MINLLNMGTLTYGFGLRDAPTAGASTDHKGIDIVLKSDNVPAVVAGEVIYSGYNSKSGNYIKVRDNSGNVHSYLHLNDKYVKSGDKVQEGQSIGKQGSTGVSTGKHLHYSVQSKDNSYIDPEKFLKGASGEVIDYTGTNVMQSTFSDSIKGVVSPILKVILLIVIFIGAVFMLMKALDISVPTKANLLKGVIANAD